MSMGPVGIASSVAGSPFAQGQGADVQRAEQETAGQARQRQSSQKAEQAAGVGQTEHDEEATDRDADGRRPWELPAAKDESPPSGPEDVTDQPRGKDPSGLTGRQLDVSG